MSVVTKDCGSMAAGLHPNIPETAAALIWRTAHRARVGCGGHRTEGGVQTLRRRSGKESCVRSAVGGGRGGCGVEGSGAGGPVAELTAVDRRSRKRVQAAANLV